jgi:hypothetical protein
MEPMPIFEDYHRTIIGYHGTTRAIATAVVSHQAKMRVSKNDDDWLGHGVYFWEYAPQRAWQWAKDRYGGDVAVLGAMIRLGNCLDLLEPANALRVKALHDRLKKESEAAGTKLPRNFNAKKKLDCAVFEYAAAILELDGEPLDTIRGVYVPTSGKQRLWDRSWLYHEAHIQLCVRNPAAILGAWLLRPSE